VLIVLAAVSAVAMYEAWPYWTADPEAEVASLIELLQVKPGMTVAEVGAGDGSMTVVLARRLGPESKILSTELNADKLDRIRKAVSGGKLENVKVIAAGELHTRLPEQCCDAIFMRRVYHHFAEPALLNASLFEALQPGGRLAVIDFTSRFWLPKPGGVPEDRSGHGLQPEIVAAELISAGFDVERRINDWPGRNYCVLARKPE
jgi:ubiquinone/menaquinone biosynthesis C-methylase UbiE